MKKIDVPKNIIGKNIKTYRTLREMKQTELADLLFVSNSVISKWENGQSTPNLATLKMIADALDIDLQKLYSDTAYSDNLTNSVTSSLSNKSIQYKKIKFSINWGYEIMVFIIIVLSVLSGFITDFLVNGFLYLFIAVLFIVHFVNLVQHLISKGITYSCNENEDFYLYNTKYSFINYSNKDVGKTLTLLFFVTFFTYIVVIAHIGKYAQGWDSVILVAFMLFTLFWEMYLIFYAFRKGVLIQEFPFEDLGKRHILWKLNVLVWINGVLVFLYFQVLQLYDIKLSIWSGILSIFYLIMNFLVSYILAKYMKFFFSFYRVMHK